MDVKRIANQTCSLPAHSSAFFPALFIDAFSARSLRISPSLNFSRAAKWQLVEKLGDVSRESLGERISGLESIGVEERGAARDENVDRRKRRLSLTPPRVLAPLHSFPFRVEPL